MMTHYEFIRMARDAGFQEGWTNLWAENFERFAALVAAAEREACAKLCDDMTTGDRVSFDWERGASDCAHAIRAKNQPPEAARGLKMNEQGISAFCLGNGALKCDGCLQERNWQTLNQLPDALRLAIQKTAIRIDDTDCILAGRPFYIGPQPPKNEG